MIIYIFWSGLWVVLSDYVTHLLVHGPNSGWKVESYKGVVYVLVSGLILFLAVRERDRKHRTERQRNESILQCLKQSGLVGIYEWGPDGCVKDANSIFLESLGYTREELTSGKLTRETLTPPEYWKVDQIADRQISETGCCALYEKEAIRKDGSRIQVLVGRARLEGSKDGGVGYALDISQMKLMESKHSQLQQQVFQSEKLNALGQLAGGIAHDFNNLLSIIVGYACLTDYGLGSKDAESQTNLAHILRAAEKGKNLTRKLLAFASRQALRSERVNLNELITQLHDMLSRVIEERVKLELRLGSKVGNIEAEPSQIEQVILNLVVNARDAMPVGGTLTIETFPWAFPDSAHPARNGEYFAVRVTDTGIGMNESVRLRIFEPFFTTKHETGGTGLGLATVYGIVKQCRGHIEVDSKAGEGSTFTVYFPREQGPQLVPKKVDETITPAVGSETILLVEDMQEIREMTAVILKHHGYNVLEACDGDDAVRVAAAHFGPIHLVVTDVIMPKLNGPEAIRLIRLRRSSTKAIYMTGYFDEVLSTNLGMDETILEKPVRPNALLDKVRRLLDQPDSEASAGD